MLGEDWANCLVIAVQSPVQISHFLAVGDNLSGVRCPNNNLAGVLLSHLPEVLSERRCLMIEGRARLRGVGVLSFSRGYSVHFGHWVEPAAGPGANTRCKENGGWSIGCSDFGENWRMEGDFRAATADAIEQMRGRLPIEPIVLWLSKGRVVVWQTYANLSAGKYADLVERFEVKPLLECKPDDVTYSARGLLLVATVGKFNQRDQEKATGRFSKHSSTMPISRSGGCLKRGGTRMVDGGSSSSS